MPSFNDGYTNNLDIFAWINSGTFNVNWSIKIDALSSVMLVVVTLISSLVHIYSIGYMSHDPHKPRFMAYLSLFTFAMLMLVTSDNFTTGILSSVYLIRCVTLKIPRYILIKFQGWWFRG